MKRILFIITILSATASFAQLTESEEALRAVNADTANGWKIGGVTNINATQVSLSNWAAGGQSSLAINGLANIYADYKKDNSSWDNLLNLNYGLVRIGEGEFVKSDDRIELNSKYGRKATSDWYYAGLFNFKSQFQPGYKFPEKDSILTSDFMAPGYFLGAIGMDYKPNPNFTVFISPITAKLTVVANSDLANMGAFGVEGATYDSSGNVIEKGETTRLELGGYLRLLYKRDLMENVTFQTNLDVFSSYSDDPTHLDINWNNLLSMKVNKYLNASVSTSLIYDHDITITEIDDNGDPELDARGNEVAGPRTQFKYVIAIGFQYAFGNEKDS